MKKFFPFFVVFVVLLPAAVSAETSGWFGGFSISSEGFISDEVFEDAEWVGFDLFIEPWSFRMLTPSLSAGLVLPAVPFNPGQGMARAEFSFELFDFVNNPFSRIIDLENSYSPLLSAGVMMPFLEPGIGSLYYSFAISPFRLKTGSGRFSIFSITYLFDHELGYSGLGVCLLDFRLFLI